MLRQSDLNARFITGNYALLAGHPQHWPCVSFSNHDVLRTVSRFGGAPEGDPALAKLMLALLLSIKGTVLLYQGEELGLPEIDLRAISFAIPWAICITRCSRAATAAARRCRGMPMRSISVHDRHAVAAPRAGAPAMRFRGRSMSRIRRCTMPGSSSLHARRMQRCDSEISHSGITNRHCSFSREPMKTKPSSRSSI